MTVYIPWMALEGGLGWRVGPVFSTQDAAQDWIDANNDLAFPLTAILVRTIDDADDLGARDIKHY